MKEKNVLEFYLLCNNLKTMLRQGWKTWQVDSERIESIAEHIFGTQMLAIAIYCEYDYKNIDLKKVLLMLAVHETEEILIGDLTPFDPNYTQKANLGHKAVKQIFGNLNNSINIEKLIYEFDEKTTPEAQFAYCCDKLEADIQCKIYDSQLCLNLHNQEKNPVIKVDYIKKLIEQKNSWSDLWIKNDKKQTKYDENFEEITNYLLATKLSAPQKIQKQSVEELERTKA